MNSQNGMLVNELYGKFTQIPNIIIQDTNIKHSAFRQYCYLLSKPTGWKVRNKDITNMIGIAESTIASNFKNLINNKYMDRSPCKNVEGKFIGGYNYRIFALPTITNKNTDSVNTSSRKTIEDNNTYSNKPSNIDYMEMMYEAELNKKKKSRAYIQKPKK